MSLDATMGLVVVTVLTSRNCFFPNPTRNQYKQNDIAVEILIVLLLSQVDSLQQDLATKF